MFERSKTDEVRDLAASLVRDKKFRRQLLSAVSHGTEAQRRAARKIGFYAAMLRLQKDPMLRRELNKVVSSLDKAWARVERKRSHKVRNTLLVVGGVGGAVAIAAKMRVHKKLPVVGGRMSP